MITSEFNIALIPGDGIGAEVTGAAVDVLNLVEQRIGGFTLQYDELYMGAKCYQETACGLKFRTSSVSFAVPPPLLEYRHNM